VRSASFVLHIATHTVHDIDSIGIRKLTLPPGGPDINIQCPHTTK
jgi:hypothetical protein